MSCWIEARQVKTGRLTGSHREQARSHNWIEYI